MPIITRFGGADSGGLNFKVSAYSELPASGTENEIAVITNTTMTDYFLAAEQKAVSNGTVWIRTGTSSPAPIYADKKHTTLIYPIDVKQYVNSEWKSVDAYIRIDGAWTRISVGKYYQNGIFSVPHTYKLINAVYVENSDSVSMTSNGGGVDFEMYARLGPVSLTNVNTISMKYKVWDVTGGGGDVHAVLFVSPNTNATHANNTAIAAASSLDGSIELSGDLSLSVANLSGDYYIFCGSHPDGRKPSQKREFVLREVS